ncbi:FtsX-like permease family protein [Thioalkalivibrio sp. ALgr3]|uniref:ABC transporter permease n=1 Tax=Thioalkalivibrio sp. ALgr3 TaxID=1239292 RepID=UPI00036518E2|nr:FtsX-like permease family protein [Thioalkalivibrio sp. ALgr3]
MGLIWRAWMRDWRRRPLQRVLTLLGVVIAVAVVLAVDLANQSAQRAFDRSMEAVAGAATHQVLGPPQGFAEAVYAELRSAGQRETAPVVEGAARLEDGRSIYLLGVDPFAEGPFRGAASDIGAAPVQRLLSEPGTVLPPRQWFAEQDAADGDRVELQAADGRHAVRVLAADGAGEDDGRVWVTDIATAQILLGRDGRLDRIDLRLEDAEAQRAMERALEQAAGAAGVNPEELEIVASGARDQASRELARAFRINLTAMSLLALLIAAFLVYNTQTFSVLRRREVLSSLRLLGAGRGRVVAVVLLEAALVGLIGTLLGALAGVALAQALVAQVAQTVTDHFFVAAVTRVTPRPLALLAVLVLGVGVALLAALAPALEAARHAGPSGQGAGAGEARARRRANRLALTSLGLLVAGAGVLITGVAGLPGAFFGLFLLIAGFVLLLPRVLGWTLRGLAVVSAGRSLPRIGLRSLERSLSRSGPAASALTLALAATIAVSVMVGSFRGSVEQWLGQALTSDLYVTPVAPAAARDSARLPQDWAGPLLSESGAESLSTGTTVETGSDAGRVELFVVRPHPDWLEHLPLLEVDGPRDGLVDRIGAGDAVLVTEPFAAHHDLQAGDDLELAVPGGRRTFTVAGVYRDYATPQGRVMIPHGAYARDGPAPEGVGSFGLVLPPDVDPEAAVERLEAWLAQREPAAIVTRPEALEQESMAIFDRTFAVTHLLRVITLVVAFIAILGALMALQMERAREFATLRSLGLEPRGVRGLVLLQGGVLGLFAVLAAIPAGLGMGWILIEVINRQAFGWGMDLRWPGREVAGTVAIGLLAALLASLWPAWRMARMRLLPALREVA